MANPQSDVGEVQYLTVRECAENLGIHAQTLKNWLTGDKHGAATLLVPVRVGRKYNQLIIPVSRWDRFVVRDWPAIRQSMEDRGWKPKKPGRLLGS